MQSIDKLICARHVIPVVPRGQARIRTQVSAHHTEVDLRLAVERLAEVRRQLLG